MKKNRTKRQAAGSPRASDDPQSQPPASEPVIEPMTWLWRNVVGNRTGRILLSILAIVTILAAIGDSLGKLRAYYNSAMNYFESAKWPAQPVILFIYPDREFGTLRKVGFERGIAPFENSQTVHVQYLASSFDALKAGKISEIEAELVSRLKANTVAAVVAPSVTEATRPVIELVRSINPKIPIMLESSIDPADLNWDDDDRLFRLSSGVDTRGTEIGHVIAKLVIRKRPVAILAEAGPATYGGKMLRYASNTSPLVAGVPTFRYTPGALKNELTTLLTPPRGAVSAAPEVNATLRDPAGVVFFLGVGADMEFLLEKAYREESPFPARAKLVGIMNAYKLSQLYRAGENRVRSELILEVTDFDFIFPFNPPEPAVVFQMMLANNTDLSPIVRDQAYSYDEATLLGAAIKSAAKAKSYSDGLNVVDLYLESYNGRGVTGSIAFSGRKRGSADGPRVVVGQNVGSTILRLAQYQRDVNSWVITSPGSL